MANRFAPQENFNGQQKQQADYNKYWNECVNNPVEFLAKNNINVPQQYQGSIDQVGRYALSQMGSNFMAKASPFINMFSKMFGVRM